MSRPDQHTTFLQQLSTALADIVATDEATCWSYGYDNSKRQGKPLAVLLPQNHEQVVTAVRLCNEHHIHITSRGRGTGTAGGAVPLDSAIVISFERMNRILEVDVANRLLVCEPGVTNAEVQRAAGEHGFFWPPDPSSAEFCTVGGNLGYNAAGPRAVKYGTPRENTLALQAVTGAGQSIRCGTKTTKGVVGYDLTRLLIGNEGTLALITEATLKLTPLAAAKRTLRAIYGSMGAAAEAVSAIMAQPAVPCALEFMDGSALGLLRKQGDSSIPDQAAALLMIEVDGDPAALPPATEAILAAATNAGLLDVQVAQTAEETQSLWAMRKALSPLLRSLAPKKVNEDVVVPVSRMPELINGLAEISARNGILIANFGHAGNGNIHVNMLYDPDNPAQAAAAPKCLADVFALTLSLDGSLSGEHGVGLEKVAYVGDELDANAVVLMQQIKQVFDPLGLLNPGKTIPGQPLPSPPTTRHTT